MRTKTLLTLLASLTLVAFAVGCGDSDTATKATAAGNATDAAFITDMTAHHQGAIEMARLAAKRAEHPEIRKLADDIVAAQQSEITVMGTIGRDMQAMGMTEHGSMGMSQSEMGMDMDLPMLRRASPFDRAFIDMMVPHHKGAIAMAKALLKDGQHPALRKMAGAIISAQTAEITQMSKWRKAWFGSAAADDGGHGSDEDSMEMDG